jgi:UDP-perosamine 4-acetyltransferase
MPGRLSEMKIVVIGGGGHAKVVIEVLLAAGWEVAGFTDAGTPAGRTFGTVPCLGGDAALPAVRAAGVETAIVALGDNALRARLAAAVRALGFTLGNAVHPRACLSPSVGLGSGIAVMAGAVINAATTIGDGSIVNTGATVDHDNRIGAFVHIAPGCHLAGYVTIGDGALIGVGSTVGRGRPLSIGAGAVAGSGSVVIHDVPAGATVFGNPARQPGAADPERRVDK